MKTAQESLAEILAAASCGEIGEEAVEIEGSDPVFPTRYRIGTAGAAALAALGLAVARIWKLRSGRAQRARVNLRAAAASLRSNSYLKIDGKAPPGPWDPLSGFYAVRDGRWIALHCNFPNHRAAATGVLKVPEDKEGVARAAREWEGEALEDAIHAAGGCAGYVRTEEEWALRPQAQAVARQPLLEIARIGDAPAEPLPPGARPLAGIRVLDLTRVLAGPTCARTLAEHGADVLRISARHLPDSGAMDLDTGIGKLSASVDLRAPEGIATLRGLAREADVFSQSYRPGTLDARGFSPQALAALRPGIVCVSLSAWGGTGPWRARRGFDSIVQAVSGMSHASRGEEGPRRLPVSAIDFVSGYLMAFGAMLALARRAREGGSWLVRVALARVGRWIVDRGLLAPAEFSSVPRELPEDELKGFLAEMDAPDGRIRHLKPVLELSETQGRWERPPVPLGYHPPAWPAR